MVVGDRQGQRWAPIILLLLKDGVVGGVGCCSLLCSETIKWTVISPGSFVSIFSEIQHHTFFLHNVAKAEPVQTKLLLI